ncbi:hypothetical protein MBRA_50110 (plasmid) [Mycobacterium branderi]|uniref:Phosphoenolpyruvate synthase n=1 Tax=Mycobacterium branderi TaxID=43348 RepID=A0ABM7KUA5_9MYCO|nr:hypothetical protein MBRA_50110 [Mycobacterium branderi]
MNGPTIFGFEDLADLDESVCRNLVGGKALNLGVMAAYGLPVPPGFCVSAQAYATFLEANAMDELIRDALDTIDFGDAGLVEDATATIRELVRSAKVPAEVAADIEKAYSALGEEVLVAVRSSGTAEDMADASFAGCTTRISTSRERPSCLNRLGGAGRRCGQRGQRHTVTRMGSISAGRVSPWWCKQWSTRMCPGSCLPPIPSTPRLTRS